MQYLLRYKIIPAIFFIVFSPVLGFSQLRDGINQSDHDEKDFHFGIYIGINRSHFNFTHHPLFLQRDSVMVVESVNSTGLNLAWLVEKRISDHFAIRTFPLDLTFTEKAFEYVLKYPDRVGGEDTLTTKKVQSISMSLPVQLKFCSDRIGNFKVYMLGGLKAEYDMAANAGARKAENLIKLNRFDYGIEAGLGFHFYYPYFVLTPEIKMGWGLSNLHSRDPNLKFSNVIDKVNSRTVTFSITVE